MYTLSMRPAASHKPTNVCMNFEQESCAWKPSTFSDEAKYGMPYGIDFHSPLENIDISPKQLSALIAGLDSAYDQLANMVYKEAESFIKKTAFGDRDTFVACLPRGIFETKPDISVLVTVPSATPAMPPYLVNREENKAIVFAGSHWVITDIPSDIDTYDSAGTCFGWDVRYKEDMPITCAITGDDLGECLSELLTSLTYLDTDAKVLLKNLEAAQ